MNNVDIDKFVDSVRKLKEKFVNVIIYLMCNFPSETRQHVDIQIDGIKTLKKMGVIFCIFNFHRKVNTNIPFDDIDQDARERTFNEVIIAAK